MNRAFEEFGAYHGASFSLTESGAPERVTGGQVSVGFFRSLGVRPVVGRLFEPGEDEPGADPQRVLLSHGLWTRRFGGDPGIVGRTIRLDDRATLVVGVLPAGTPWLNAANVFVPFIRRPNANRGSWEYIAIGRLKPGVTFDAALDDMKRVARELEERFPENKGLSVSMQPSGVWIASAQLRQTLWVLLGASGLLLLIACVNVTNLLLARASARVRESAVRTALGAGPWDLVRERLTESMVLAVTGAALGWLVAIGLLRILQSFDPGGIPRLNEVAPNGWAVAFAIVSALIVGIVTGLVPALHTPLARLAPVLSQGQRGVVGERRHDRVRSVFVGAEVAVSLVLLVGAALLVRSLLEVLRVDRGFQTEQRLLATVSIPGSYPDARRSQIVTDILARLSEVPEIVSAAAVSGRPLSAGSTGLGILAADHLEPPGGVVPWASWRIVTKDYFKAMGLPLIAGRGFAEQDLIAQPWRAIVSKRLADLLWPGENPVGKTAILWRGQNERKGEVIGVVGNMRERGLENDLTLAVYFPAYGALDATTLNLVMHTRGKPENVTPSLRAVVSSIDANLPVSGIRTLEEIVTTSVATRRFTMLLVLTFAGLALVLALAGVYGVLAYTVARRTPEIGLRLALGAQQGRVIRRVLAQGMLPVAIGAAAGLAATYWLSRFMTTLVFGVTATDPMTYAAVALALLATALMACYLPARQVMRVDPVVALRAE
jgi:predicted permease